MKLIKQDMSYKKSTPGTHVYECKEEGTVVPSLYIKRSAFGSDNAPQTIKVTIEDEKT